MVDHAELPPAELHVDREEIHVRYFSGSKRMVLACCLVVLVGTSVAAAWFVWVPKYRPSLESGETFGVDVSTHQGPIDWERVAEDDISFAYIKATEGGDHVDDRFEENWTASAKAGLTRGAYHFFTLCRTGEDQADNFLSTVPLQGQSLPPAIDLEIGGNCAQRPDPDDVTEQVTDFIERVEQATDQRMVLYVGDDWEKVYPMRDELARPVWFRRILRRPPTDDWHIWQFTYRASVDGIDGEVDLNVMREPG